MDIQRGCLSVNMYAKTKELGPMGGRTPGTPPRSANEYEVCTVRFKDTFISY